MIFLRLLAMLVPTLAALQIATQRVAATYSYHVALGAPLFAHWYAPWKLPLWVWHWGAAQPGIYRGPLYVILGGVVTGIVCSLVVRLVRGGQREQDTTTFGSAAWAEKGAVERSGLA